MKTTTNILLLAGLFLELILSSCKKEDSDTVDQDKIWSSYEVFYDKNQDKTFARATFKFSNALGTNLELKSPAEVKFNGDVLTFQSVFAYYEKQYSGFISAGTFSYTDLDGNTFTNSISGIRSIAFPVTDTIHSAASYSIIWGGDSLKANESVSVWIDGTAANNAELFYQNNLNSYSVICAASQLQNLGNGAATAWMERVYAPAVQQVTSAGGELRGKYKALDLHTQVAP